MADSDDVCYVQSTRKITREIFQQFLPLNSNIIHGEDTHLYDNFM